ncbi:histidinol-phosphate transaminase [Nesterenkonia sp. NBAIMH1]|uniref:histidinol-phosphate transaminase n=1 Tax=Nesterenkonia sp. NBAIMH1 TaxID=2600320 RepID=UPI0011B6C930|nr:histidinol-phosphate transaminase [Nesterenkonia sp. NBAIMH1]
MPSASHLPSAPRVRSVVDGLPAYVAGRSAQTALTAALASNESHFPPLPSVTSLMETETSRIHRYPDMASADLREAIAAHVGVSADEVAVGPGSSGVLQQILSAVCDPGHEVIFAWRSFEAYPILAAVAGAEPVRVPLLPDEQHDLDAMAAAVTDETRVVLLCSPNNPTGVPLDAERTEDFLSRVPSHALVVIDEAYVEFQDEAGAVDALELYRRYPNVCVLRTFSKAYGLAGLRVGYAIARAPLAEGLRRTAIPFGVNRMAQTAAAASLAAHDEMRARTAEVRAERTRMIAALRGAGWTVPESQANFVWLRCGDETREAILSALADADILARGYRDDGVRITLADRGTNDRVLAVLAERGRFGSQ